MPELKIGDLIARRPIVQGGMGVGISMSGLASAVANEGGIGVIAAASIGMDEPDFYTNYLEANLRALRKEIRKAKEKTKGILGVNIMVAMTHFADLVKTALDEKIDIIFSGAGLPLDLPSYLKEGCRTKLVPIISSGRAARLLCSVWWDKYKRLPDAFVVEGPKAGGHLGFKEEQLTDPAYSLENLVAEIVAETNRLSEKYEQPFPVIAGGGVFTGADIRKFLDLGASGVQMGTRFVATDECDASQAFKQAYVDAREEDLEIIKSPVGMPGRALGNQFTREVREGRKKPFKCPYHCIKTCDVETAPYCISLALVNAKNGALRKGFAFAGANVPRVKEIMPVRKLMETLEQEYLDSATDPAPTL
jgi:nitronate monooxygenase